jgi:NAD(P)H-flavin reductase
MVTGAEVGIRGPYGTFFDTGELRGHDLVLIAGGCGLAPMRSLIQYCEDRRNDFGRITIMYGAKSPADVLFKDEIAAWKTSPNLTCHSTVDRVPGGHCHDGKVGLITTLIPPLEIDPERTVAVIVGPPVMYGFVIAELAKKGLTEDRIVVSLERYMRCGIGKCGHCTIEHLYCCIDGPVFRLNQVIHVKGVL